LRNDVQHNPSNFPTLSVLLLGQKTGARVIIENAARELCAIWSQFQPGRHSEAIVLTALERFLPIDRELDPNASVRIAFEKARRVLDESAAQPFSADDAQDAARG
jgi:hypothetical protein